MQYLCQSVQDIQYCYQDSTWPAQQSDISVQADSPWGEEKLSWSSNYCENFLDFDLVQIFVKIFLILIWFKLLWKPAARGVAVQEANCLSRSNADQQDWSRSCWSGGDHHWSMMIDFHWWLIIIGDRLSLVIDYHWWSIIIGDRLSLVIDYQWWSIINCWLIFIGDWFSLVIDYHWWSIMIDNQSWLIINNKKSPIVNNHMDIWLIIIRWFMWGFMQEEEIGCRFFIEKHLKHFDWETFETF